MSGIKFIIKLIRRNNINAAKSGNIRHSCIVPTEKDVFNAVIHDIEKSGFKVTKKVLPKNL